MAVVETRNLHKYFGEVCAVDNVSLSVREGEFLVLVGPSGSGKTSLLRMIAGLEPPTDGEIRIGDQVVNHVPPRARKIAMVFQNYALYPHMNIFDNIAFPLKNEHMSKPLIRQKVDWAAGVLKIDQFLDRKPSQLSGGERQRVALARALVREPQVFLLDEPLSNLDVMLRASAREELKQFQRQIGVTTLYVTHDQVEAMSMGDRIAVMANGRIRQLGTPQQIYSEPTDTFVATFFGIPPMNLIEREDEILGFHPEHLLPRDLAADMVDLVPMSFAVARIEYLGAESYLYGTVEGASVVAKLSSQVNRAFETGQTYDFAVDRPNLHYFNKRTTYRMGAPSRVL